MNRAVTWLLTTLAGSAVGVYAGIAIGESLL